MGLGGTAKKLQKVTNAAEELYTKMNEVIGRLQALETEVERTSQQVDRIEYDVAKQRAVIDAIAEAEGVDVEAAIESADLPADPAEPPADDGETEASVTAE